MRVRLKICGITNYADAEMSVRLGADLLGFNFYPESPRYIAPEKAREIIRRLPPCFIPVGILVQPDAGRCLKILDIAGVSVLQIHKPKNIPDFSVIPAPVIAAYQLQPGQNVIPLDRGENMILLDRFVAGQYGGTGKRLDWSLIPKKIPGERLALAGGINTGNVKEALVNIHPAVIDVASGAEISPGKKDPEEIQALVRQIQRYNMEKLGSQV